MKMSRNAQQAAALARKAERQQAHIARMAAHAEHRAAVALWQDAWNLWVAASCKGPEPIHPDQIGVK
jgi:hypothetical protein